NGEIGFNTHTVFMKTIKALGTDEQIAKWMPLAMDYKILGSYAQTELGHGTYLRGLETTATFDPTTQEFIIDTPQITATKWWPGDYNTSCNLFSGISVGDIGPKMAFENVDNGYLIMRNIRIPKENMLSRYSQVPLY
ncbi:hypothetical protein GDO78_022256, partial [Eleutherodactylus coqui]